MDWTLEERGLAGLSDLAGIPWTMPMELFFEACVETVLRAVAGSQRSLVPDLVLEPDGCTLVIDAKYKRHWEELQQGRWAAQEDALREEHRQDLLQILAYANLAEAPLAVCCLLYPCSAATWESLRARRRLFHKAQMSVRSRRILIWLTAVPMCAAADRIAGPLADEIRNILRAAS